MAADLPKRIIEDLKSLPDDLRFAKHEGKLAADREMADIDQRLGAER